MKKKDSSIHNIAFSNNKAVLFESGEKFALILLQKRKKFLLNMLVGFDVRRQRGMDFFIAKCLQISSNKVRSSIQFHSRLFV